MSSNLAIISGTATDQVNKKTNTTGDFDAIMEIVPDDGTKLILENFVPSKGEGRGLPIYAVLRDSNNNDLPPDTQIAIAFERPTDSTESIVSDEFNVQPYRELAFSKQSNSEYVDSVKHELDGAELHVRDIDRAYVVIKSSAQIDWANSKLQIEPKGVQRRDLK